MANEKQSAQPRLVDFAETLRMKYALLDYVDDDLLTPKEREFLQAQVAEAKARKKKLAS